MCVYYGKLETAVQMCNRIANVSHSLHALSRAWSIFYTVKRMPLQGGMSSLSPRVYLDFSKGREERSKWPLNIAKASLEDRSLMD